MTNYTLYRLGTYLSKLTQTFLLNKNLLNTIKIKYVLCELVGIVKSVKV